MPPCPSKTVPATLSFGSSRRSGENSQSRGLRRTFPRVRSWMGIGVPGAPSFTIASVPGYSFLLVTFRSRCTAFQSAVSTISMGSWLANSGSASAFSLSFVSVSAPGGHGFGILGFSPTGSAAGFWA